MSRVDIDRLEHLVKLIATPGNTHARDDLDEALRLLEAERRRDEAL
jgi:hypothetical protein